VDLSQPLSDDEYQELEDFLMSDGMPEEAMDISMLDGFLTALLIGPNMLTPSQWLPRVWGATDEQPMTWQSEQQAERMMGLVLRLMNDILWQLDEDPEGYEPLIYQHKSEDEDVPVIDEWCMGFIAGIALDEEGWAPLLDEEAPPLLTPILLYGTEIGWQQLEEDKELADRHDEFAEALGDIVLGIRDYWLPLRKAKSTFRHSEAVPGRNDPCPCGSGRKFKKCCGDPARMH